MTRADPPGTTAHHLALIGGRGCGKTSATRELAARHPDLRLLELDALAIEEGGGRPVAEIVADGGWRAWRELEYRVLERSASTPGTAVIDCGGGIVVDIDAGGSEVFSQRKVDLLRGHCRVVYLRCDSELLGSRIAGDPGRPALSAEEPFPALMARREAWYQAAAHRVIEADALSTRDLAQEIASWFFAGAGET